MLGIFINGLKISSSYKKEMILKQDLRYFQEKQILVASIAIGTNSTHLWVAEINLELKSFSIKFTDKSTTRLGERDEEGNLTEESIQRALVTLKRFKEYCKSNGVKPVSYTHLTLPTMS